MKIEKRKMPIEMLDLVAGRFRVLGDTSRLMILQLLMHGPLTVGEIVEKTGRGQANVSKHLSILAGAGLVSRTRQGTRMLYEIADPVVFELCSLMCGAVRSGLEGQIKTTQRALKKM